MYIESIPYGIGSIAESARNDFSQPFTPDWRTISKKFGVEGADRIILTDFLDEPSFGLPISYRQFVSAIGLAVTHERGVREDAKLETALLTMRQSRVDAGESQQCREYVTNAHCDEPNHPFRLYTIADIQSTQYYPDLAVDEVLAQKGSYRVPVRSDKPYLEFRPYELVHASGRTFHRSPPMAKQAVRTFMRLSFQYTA